MAQRPLMNRMTVKNVTYDLADLYARAQIADIAPLQTRVSAVETKANTLQSNKVAKAGDTMSGNLIMSNGKEVRLAEGGGTYVSLFANSNNFRARAIDKSNNVREIRLIAPAGQASDVFSIQFITSNATYNMDFTGYTTFSGTAVTAKGDMEYTNNTAIDSLTITWPAVTRGLIFGINFTSGASFSGVTHRTLGGTVFTPKSSGNPPNTVNQRYNLVCWHDGRDYWCLAQGSAI